MIKLGNAIEVVAKPVARALNLSCLDEHGQLKPESGCGKRRDAINRFGDAIYDFLWGIVDAASSSRGVSELKRGGDAASTSIRQLSPYMDFVVIKTTSLTQQFAVAAETPDAAEEAAKAGQGKAIGKRSSEDWNVQLRPSAAATGQRPLTARPLTTDKTTDHKTTDH
jgi:hypothetical protein